MSKNIIQGVRENWTIIVTLVTVVGFLHYFYYQQSTLNKRVVETEVEVILIISDVNGIPTTGQAINNATKNIRK